MTRREALGLVALGLVFRLLFFHGFVGSDDVVYIDQAHQVTQGERTWDLHPHNQRHGMVYPIAALLAIGGGAFPVLALFPLILSLASILAARDLGERFGSSAGSGRAAAVLLAVLPIDVVFASQLFPDLPASALVALGFWVLTRSGRPAAVLGAGLLVGWALLVKESMVVFLPFLAGWLFLHRRRALLPWLAGVALPLAGDLVAAGLATGDPLFHLHAVREGRHAAHLYRPLAGPGEVPARLFLRFPALLIDPRHPSIVQYGITGLLGVFGLGVVLVRWPRRIVAAAWLLSAYALYVLWPASIAPYVPAIPVEQRYLALLSIPLCVVAGQGVAFVSERFGRSARRTVMGVAIAASLVGCSLYSLQYRGAADNARAFLAWRSDAEPLAPVVTDPVGCLVLSFLSGYDPLLDVQPFPAAASELVVGSLVFVDEKRLGFGGEDVRQPVPDWVREPPAAWSTVWERAPEPSGGSLAVARVIGPLLPADRRARFLRREPAVARRVTAAPETDPPGR